MKIFYQDDLPWQLSDVVDRMKDPSSLVYGFELELLADFVSR